MIQNQGFLITCCYSYVTILSLEKVDFPPSVVATGLLPVASFDSNEATGNWHILRLMQLQLEVQSLPVGLCWVASLFEVHRAGPVNTRYQICAE